jgi:putative ABC transport system ATP-binding protein
MSEPIARLRGVSKTYGQGSTLVRALAEIDLDVHAGEVVLIEGPSGSGKTTLLHILGLLQRPDCGEVWISGRRLDAIRESRMPDERRRSVAFIFQGYNLLESLCVRDNVAVAELLRAGSGVRAPVLDAIARLGLARRGGHLPEQLSGGEKQRTAIARALASRGKLVLADEPTGNLDWANAQEVARALSDLAHTEGRAVVMVSHDARLHAYADRIIHLLDGRISSDQRSPGGTGAAAVAPPRPAPQERLADFLSAHPSADLAPQPRPRFRARQWLAGLFVAGLVAGAAWILVKLPNGAVDPPKSPPAASTLAAVPPLEPTPFVAAAPGAVEPASQLVAIRSERQGRIKSILKRAGERIVRDEPLVVLDDAMAAAAVEQRKADLVLAEANLARLLAWDRPEERAKAQAGVDRAQARLDRARRDLNRVESLAAGSSAPPTEVSLAIEEERLAAAGLDEARQVLLISQAGPIPEEIAVSKAYVEQARAALQFAEAEKALRTIVSPLDGHVIYRHLEPGEVVDPESPIPILSVGNIDQVRIRAEVDEADILRVFVGQRVLATAEAFTDKTYPGTVVHLEPLMGRKSIRTNRTTEQQDTKVREVIIEMAPGTPAWPIDLQLTVRFLAGSADPAASP